MLLAHKKISILCIVLAAILTHTAGLCERLIFSSDLTYLGAFRVPQDRYGCENWDSCTYSYGGKSLAYNPDGNGGAGSLFSGGNQVFGNIAEMSIPDLVITDDISQLHIATNLQDFADPVDGHRNELFADGSLQSGSVYIGGLMKWGSSLIGTVYHYYPGDPQYRTHFKSTTDLSNVSDVARLYEVGVNGVGRYLAGYMCAIPDEHQASLGGQAITGHGGGNVVSTTSTGPSLWVFDPDSIGTTDPVPATPLAYYLSPTFLGGGTEHDQSDYANTTSTFVGAAFPSGTDSILVFGRHGMGEPCYGEPTDNEAMGGEPVPGEPGVQYCYTPVGGESKGYFAPPYVYRVWAYSVSELLAVKNNQKTPQQAMPYAIFNLTLPFSKGDGKIAGVTYDDTTRKLYVSQEIGEVGQYDVKPIIHVFRVGQLKTLRLSPGQARKASGTGRLQ